MLNDRVKPPVEIEWLVTDRLDRFSRNICRDPRDGVEYDESTMTHLEAGCVCLYREEADEIRIHLPYRVMDRELARLTAGLYSFRVLLPAVTSLTSQAKNRKACLRDFALSADELPAFRRRLLDEGWILEKDTVDADALLMEMGGLIEMVESGMAATTDLVNRLCSGKGPQTQQELDELLGGLGRIRQIHMDAPVARMRLATKLDRLSREFGRHADFVRCSVEMERVGTVIEGIGRLNLDRHEREAVHLFRINTGQTSVGSEGHLRPLSNELQDLARFHPSLRHLSADGKDLLFTLEGMQIRVTPTAIVVTGDPGVLRAFLNAAPMQEGADVSDRFRLIVPRRSSNG